MKKINIVIVGSNTRIGQWLSGIFKTHFIEDNIQCIGTSCLNSPDSQEEFRQHIKDADFIINTVSPYLPSCIDIILEHAQKGNMVIDFAEDREIDPTIFRERDCDLIVAAIAPNTSLPSKVGDCLEESVEVRIIEGSKRPRTCSSNRNNNSIYVDFKRFVGGRFVFSVEAQV